MKWKDRVSGLSAVGVFGGMGPLASVEFVRTIYRLHHGEEEQKSPIVFLYSNPHIPDRTTCFLKGDDSQLVAQLTNGLQLLAQRGVPVIVICCFTIHHLLPRIPLNLRRRVLSLIDVLAEEILESRGTYLMACSTGTRRLRLLERHVRWPQVRERIVYPNDSDQTRLHDAIYTVKKHHSTKALYQLLLRFAAKYKVDGLVAGCTELHLLTRNLTVPPVKLGDFPFLDPLTYIAIEIAGIGKSH